jgi:hypothetical protein
MNFILEALIRNLFYLSITIPFFNSAMQAMFGFDLNFIYILFLAFCFIYCFINGFSFYKTGMKWFYFFLFIFVIQTLQSVILTQEVNPIDTLYIQVISVVLGFCFSFFCLTVQISNILFDWTSWICLLLFSLVGILFSLGSFDLISLGVETQSRGIYNSSPISISILCCFSIICLFVTNMNIVIKFLLSIPFFILLWFLGSRGPVISLLGVVFFALVMIRNRNSKMLLFSCFFVFIPFLVSQVLSIRDTVSESDSERLMIVDSAFNLISSNPLFSYWGRFVTQTGFVYAHNFFMEMIVDAGLFYTISLISIILFILIRFFNVKHLFDRCELLVFFILVYVFCVLQFSLPSIEIQKIFLPLMFSSISLIIKKSSNLDGYRSVVLT